VLLVDTSALLAGYDGSDEHHEACLRFFNRDERRLLSPFALAELDYLLLKARGGAGEPREATLLKRQQGRCAYCGLFFRDGEVLEVDHITPKHSGGIDAYYNWQLLRGHCHDTKTAADVAAVQAG